MTTRRAFLSLLALAPAWKHLLKKKEPLIGQHLDYTYFDDTHRVTHLTPNTIPLDLFAVDQKRKNVRFSLIVDELAQGKK